MVVLPEPVPPEMRMLRSAWMLWQRNFAASLLTVPRLVSSSSPKRSFANRRIVRSGPERDRGGMIAFTRDPSGSRASTIGDDSSMRRPIWPTIFVMILRNCESSENRRRVCERRPSRSIQMSEQPFTITSEIVESALRAHRAR